MREYIPLHDFPVEQGLSTSPPKKHGGIFINTYVFLREAFSWQLGDTFWGAVLHGGLMTKSCQGWRSFTNVFSINLKAVYKS